MLSLYYRLSPHVVLWREMKKAEECRWVKKHFWCDGNWWSCERQKFLESFSKRVIIAINGWVYWAQTVAQSFRFSSELCTLPKGNFLTLLYQTALETWENRRNMLHVKQQLKTFYDNVKFFPPWRLCFDWFPLWGFH